MKKNLLKHKSEIDRRFEKSNFGRHPSLYNINDFHFFHIMYNAAFKSKHLDHLTFKSKHLDQIYRTISCPCLVNSKVLDMSK